MCEASVCMFLFTNELIYSPLILLRNENGHIIPKNLGHHMPLQKFFFFFFWGSKSASLFVSELNPSVSRTMARKTGEKTPLKILKKKVYYYIQITLPCESKDPMRQINLECLLIHSVCIQVHELTMPLPFVPVQDIICFSPCSRCHTLVPVSGIKITD